MCRSLVMPLAVMMATGFVGCRTAEDTQRESELLLRQFLAAWSPSPDIEEVVSFFTEDCACENVPREQSYYGRGGVRAYVKATYEAVPNLTVEATSVFVSGEWAACEWVMSGTTAVVDPKAPGSGRSFRVRGSSIVQFREGKIHRLSDYWDRETFLRQTGVIE